MFEIFCAHDCVLRVEEATQKCVLEIGRDYRTIEYSGEPVEMSLNNETYPYGFLSNRKSLVVFVPMSFHFRKDSHFLVIFRGFRLQISKVKIILGVMTNDPFLMSIQKSF